MTGGPATEFLLRLDQGADETFTGTLSPASSDTVYEFSGWLDLMMLFERLKAEGPEARR
ncbi:MAG: hypothetical protein LC792_06260 [Actinobacteria bacterium]|nr:hypothetical protein [Actinomycetota bacterium]